MDSLDPLRYYAIATTLALLALTYWNWLLSLSRPRRKRRTPDRDRSGARNIK
jgi:hypothetical protein